jgi:C-terminal processing protease CtpA/Prc
MLYLKPGILYDDPFEHDMSGLEYYSTGKDFNHVIISRVEPGSAGAEIGLERGDEIMYINFKPVVNMTLEEIDSIFKSRDGRGILLEIYHDKRYDKVILTLKRRI